MRRRQVRAQAASFLSPQDGPEDQFQWWVEEGCLTHPGLLAEKNSLLLLSCCVCAWSVAKSCLTLQPRGLQPSRPSVPGIFPGKNTGVGCHVLLQGIFPTQGSNPPLLRLLHCRQVLYHWATSEVKVAQSWLTLCDPMDHTVHGIFQARILERVPFPFFKRYSQTRDWTRVSCIAGRFFESQRKPTNTGVGSLSLLQRLFLTHELNQGLLHCRWILYQLSRLGSPLKIVFFEGAAGMSVLKWLIMENKGTDPTGVL